MHVSVVHTRSVEQIPSRYDIHQGGEDCEARGCELEGMAAHPVSQPREERPGIELRETREMTDDRLGIVGRSHILRGGG